MQEAKNNRDILKEEKRNEKLALPAIKSHSDNTVGQHWWHWPQMVSISITDNWGWIILLWGAVLCSAYLLAASLVSSHWMLTTQPLKGDHQKYSQTLSPAKWLPGENDGPRQTHFFRTLTYDTKDITDQWEGVDSSIRSSGPIGYPLGKCEIVSLLQSTLALHIFLWKGSCHYLINS